MARRRNNVQDFMDGFNSAYSSIRKVLQDKEMADIAKAEPVDMAPVDEVVTTPSADGGPATGTVQPVAPRQVKFLGTTSDKPLTPEQQTSARTAAMAGVLKKFGDPVGGMRLEQQAREGDQRARLTDLQINQANRAEARDKKADEDAAVLEGVDKDVAAWSTARLSNPDGTARDMTIDDQLAAGQYRVSKLIAAGRMKEANALAKDNMSFASSKIQLDTQQRSEALTKVSAQVAAGDLSGVAAFYDRFVPDGAKVKGMQVDPQTGAIVIERETIDGRTVPPVTFKSRDELMAGMNVLRDPMSLYNFSQGEFARNLQIKADARADRGEKRADNADARADRSLKIQEGQAGAAAADRTRTKNEADARAAAAVGLYKERNPNASPAEIEAVRRGVIEATPTVDKNAPAEVKLAKAMLDAGMASDMRSALEMAVTKKGQDPGELHKELVTAGVKNMSSPEAAVASADKVMAAMGYAKRAGKWSAAGEAKADAKPVGEFASQADVEAAVKAGKVKKGDRVIVNGRTATWQ